MAPTGSSVGTHAHTHPMANLLSPYSQKPRSILIADASLDFLVDPTSGTACSPLISPCKNLLQWKRPLFQGKDEAKSVTWEYCRIWDARECNDVFPHKY